MRILLHHLTPFALAPGGPQSQILHIREALLAAGVEAEFLRWYDGDQIGDVLHFFGHIPPSLLELAHDNAMKVVLTDWPAGKDSFWRRLSRAALKRTLPRGLAPYFGWDIYQQADACIGLTVEDAQTMISQFGATEERTHVLPTPAAGLAPAGCQEKGPDRVAAPISAAWLEFGKQLRIVYESLLA